jgi:hypothetical protein
MSEFEAEGFIDISGDGGLLKKITKEGKHTVFSPVWHLVSLL